MNDVRAHRVYVRPKWSMDWVLVPQLFADVVTFCAAPEMPEAVLHYNYGHIMGYGENTFANRSKLVYQDYYVKIELDQVDDDGNATTLPWYGIIKEEIDSLRGDRGDNVPSGIQKLRCLGLEYLLARTQVETSWILNAELADAEVKRCIGFNLGAGDERSSRFVPNMSSNSGALNAFVFADSLTQSQEWTAYAIVDYLLTYQSPKDIVGVAVLPFMLDTDYGEQLLSLNWWKPQFSYQGRTLKEILDSIMDRRRLMSYKLVVDASNNILLRPFTFAQALVTLPSGESVKANRDQVTWNFDGAAQVGSAVVVTDSQPTYDVVYSKGERVGVVWSMKNRTSGVSTFEKDWDSALETLYNDGSTDAVNHADYVVKVQLHRNYRRADKFKRVYAAYRVPTDWEGSTNEDVVCIKPTTTGVADAAVDTFWRPGLRIEPYLPLIVGVDYEVVSENMDDTTLAGTLPEYRRPFAVGLQAGASASSMRYFYMDRPEAQYEYGHDAEEAERQWSVTVRPQEDNLGVFLEVHGAPQHVIASDDFDSADDADEEDWQATINWKDLYVTVYTYLDSFVYGQWPDPLPPNPLDAARSLRLEIPGKRLDYIVPYTVVDVNAAGELVQSSGGFIKDDREELTDISRLAYEWYSVERMSMDVTLHNLDAPFAVGYLITTIGSGNTLKTVNSVVTQHSFDLRAATQTVRTQYGEFDVRGL